MKNTSDNSEPQLSNAWQNIGICYLFALENIEQKYRDTFMFIVRLSFGFGKTETPRLSQAELAKRCGISRPTLTAHLHKLIDLELIQQNESSKYMKEGGSEAFSYSPIFPKGYGKLWIKKEKIKEQTKEETKSQSWDGKF